MKIAVDLRKISHNPSGVGYYTLNIVRELAKNKYIELVGFTDILEGNELLELNNIIRILPYGKKVNNNLRIFGYFHFIEDKLMESQPDIFWEPNFLITRNLKTKVPRVKYLVTIHDVTPVSHPEFYSYIYSSYFKYFIRKTIKWIDGILFISYSGKQECRHYFPSSMEKKSTIIYPLVKGKLDNGQVEQEKEGTYFLYIGNIEKRKGISVLLKAFDQYRKAGGTNSLILCGTQKDLKIADLLKKLDDHTSSSIEYLGYTSEGEKKNLILKCEAIIFPSYAEGFGIPPVEALLYGKQTIVSDIGVHKEVLGKNATYFHLTNNEEESSENLKESMFNYNKHFDNKDLVSFKNKYSSDITVKKMFDFFNQLLIEEGAGGNR